MKYKQIFIEERLLILLNKYKNYIGKELHAVTDEIAITSALLKAVEDNHPVWYQELTDYYMEMMMKL